MLSTALLPVLIFTWTGMATAFVTPPCDQNLFDFKVGNCLSEFNTSMVISGYQEECLWPNVKRDYYKLKVCVDYWANETLCSGYKFLVENIFLEVHQMYFSLCPQVHDPPIFTLVMLTAPVIIITFLLPVLCVHLITWNT
ncbi:receptor activity-modifying protein 1-like isoform X2 [Cololabis saira]|uniref:receptor activity-modifying protein 1-like isoform X2 n=1 Tax=Cololabis saira TaxID=129043 RepID=UPI002AD3A432|nr:receptor activity-modifying protein 1-like isoform X2 [Cololabis saira]